MFTNIIWATDGSEHSDRALDYAIQMAQRDGAGLHVAGHRWYPGALCVGWGTSRKRHAAPASPGLVSGPRGPAAQGDADYGRGRQGRSGRLRPCCIQGNGELK
jgi:nucleotide-binding universal stress UspA family protein